MKIRIRTVDLAEVPPNSRYGRGFGPSDPDYSKEGLYQQITDFVEETFPNLVTETYLDQPYTLYVWSETDNTELIMLLKEHLVLAYPAAVVDRVNNDPPNTITIDSAFVKGVAQAPRLLASAADLPEVDEGILLALPGLEDLYLFTDYANPDPNESVTMIYVMEFDSVASMRAAVEILNAEYCHPTLFAQLENEG